MTVAPFNYTKAKGVATKYKGKANYVTTYKFRVMPDA